MLNATRLQLKNHFSYLQQFMASPRTIGTLAPSSPWLCQAMLNQVEWTGALSIAELGAVDRRTGRGGRRADQADIRPDACRCFARGL